jgi:hypothetical protein
VLELDEYLLDQVLVQRVSDNEKRLVSAMRGFGFVPNVIDEGLSPGLDEDQTLTLDAVAQPGRRCATLR